MSEILRIFHIFAISHTEQTASDGYAPDHVRSVEAIAEAYPNYPQDNVQFSPEDDEHNQVVPLDVLKVNEPRPVPAAPKRKVQIALDAPEDDENVEDDYQSHEKRPKKPVNMQPTMFFPVNFGESEGGATIAVANAFNDGSGAVRSHAIAYGMPSGEARRRATARGDNAAQRSFGY